MPDLCTQKWNECLELIRSSLNNDSRFDTWFSHTKAISLKRNILTLRLPSHFYYELYEERFYPFISNALMKVFGKDVRVVYEVAITGNKPEESMKLSRQYRKEELREPVPEPIVTPHDESFNSFLNPSLTFDNYCVTRVNKLPHSIAESIARQPFNSNFNPFFLYGDVGVGKTHLMQAIGLKIKERFPEKKVLFLPMREFQRLYANSVIEKKVPMFIKWFMQLDVLLFDDLQELSNKTKTLSDALFPIFNHLHQSGKQLVFTCDRPPMELEGMEDRLIDRFKWGITEELKKPDVILRRQILSFKANKNGLHLPEDVIDYIAESPINSVREIEGIVLGMMTRAISLGVEIDMRLAKEVLRNSIKPRKKKNINFDMIVEATAERYNLNPDVIFSKSRVRDVADARMLIMYLAHKLAGLSAVAIGRKLNRKHPTVIHGITTMKDRIKQNSETADLARSIEKDVVENV